MIDHIPAASQQRTFQPLLFAFPQKKEVTTRFIDRGTEKTSRFLLALEHRYIFYMTVLLCQDKKAIVRF